jgi:FixJ family two-component response regulator
MPNATPIVFVVHPDASVLASLQELIVGTGLRMQAFGTAQDFLAQPRATAPSCLVLDVSLPDVSGLELQTRMATERVDMPLIFVTRCRDVPTTVQAMKAGALEFLTTPFEGCAFSDAVQNALDRSRAVLAREAELRPLRERLGSLTVRERDVLELVISGQLNKQVGGQLGISEFTVKAHRGRVMRKMGAESLPHLVGIAKCLRLAVTPSLPAINPRPKASQVASFA